MQFTFTLSGKAIPPATSGVVFVPASMPQLLTAGASTVIQVFPVDQFGRQAASPVQVASITYPGKEFTVAPAPGGFSVTYVGSPVDVNAPATLVVP